MKHLLLSTTLMPLMMITRRRSRRKMIMVTMMMIVIFHHHDCWHYQIFALSFQFQSSPPSLSPSFHASINTHIHHLKHPKYPWSAAATAATVTTTQLNGVASRIYDMDAITESTTDFREQFASIADNDDVDFACSGSKNGDTKKDGEKPNNHRKKRIQKTVMNTVENEQAATTKRSAMHDGASSHTRKGSTHATRNNHNVFNIQSTQSNSVHQHPNTNKEVISIYNNESYHHQHHGQKSYYTVRRNRGLGLHLSYKSAIQVLRMYHSIHGHLVIPRRYTIPSSQPLSSSSSSSSSTKQLKETTTTASPKNIDYYPTQWHDIDIASTVYNMNWWTMHVKSNPERVKELNALGFVWERLQPEWNLVLEAIVTYKEIYGHVKVPATFIVPYDDNHEKTKDSSSSSSSIHDQDHNEKEYENHNHNNNHITWPKATWGIPLGNCVHRIRTRGDFLRNDEVSWSRRRQLDGLGFIWDVQEHSFERFFTALKIYAKVEQQQLKYHQIVGGRSKVLRIPRSFVIPSSETIDKGTLSINSTRSSSSSSRSNNNTRIVSSSTMANPWPKELWGYPLGVKCAAIRQKGLYVKNNPERQKALQEIGFQMSGNNSIGWLNIVWASAIYSKIHGQGTLDVPIHFVVPSPPFTNASHHNEGCRSSSSVRSNVSDSPSSRTALDSIVVDDSWPWPGKCFSQPNFHLIIFYSA